MTDSRPYYFRIRARVIGPKQLPEMQRLAQRAQINNRTAVSRDGTNWESASQFPEIFQQATASPPPLSPASREPTTAATAQPEPEVEVLATEWYFARNGQQHPEPVTINTLLSYIEAGTLTSKDLVFREGWSAWQPVRSVPELHPVSIETQFVKTPAPTPGAFGTSATATIGGEYASFFPRVGATLLDGLFLSCFTVMLFFLCVLLFAIIGNMTPVPADSSAVAAEVMVATLGPALLGIWLVGANLVGVAYYTVLDSSRKQGTWGKQIVGLKVVTLDGQRLSTKRALARCLCRYVASLLPLGIGFLMAAFTEKKQALHELMAGCLTVNQ